MQSDPAIRIRGLWKAFGGNVAVGGLDLDVPRGSFFGLLGRNGAGKTTTIRMATALLRPDAGWISIGGVDVWSDTVRAKSRIGVLPEDLRLFERLTGLELLSYVGLLRGMDPSTIRSRSEDLLGVLELADCATTMVIDYSHGMRKKIALAAALLHGPGVLFLDEPFEAVDTVSARTIKEVLETYTSSGHTVLFSSHVMDTVERLCDRIAILHRGRLVCDGPLIAITGGRSLEDVFIERVGESPRSMSLGWLNG